MFAAVLHELIHSGVVQPPWTRELESDAFSADVTQPLVVAFAMSTMPYVLSNTRSRTPPVPRPRMTLLSAVCDGEKSAWSAVRQYRMMRFGSRRAGQPV